METYTAVICAIILLALLLLMRVPVAFGLLAAGLAGVALLRGGDHASSVAAGVPFEVSTTYVYTIIPLFIALGVLAREGGLAESGFAAAAKLLRRLPGGLAVSAVVACAGFAAVSGSSVATVVTLGPIATREMVRHGYDLRVAAGVVGAAGTLGVMIPPSIVLVIYGILTGESIGALLIAGIVPGLLTALIFGVSLVIRAHLRPDLMGGGERLQEEDLRGDVRWMNIAKLLAIFAVVIGTIYTGIATATEAAALAAGLAFIFFLGDLRHVASGKRWTFTGNAFGEAVRMSSMTLALLIGGSAFTYFLVVAGVPRDFANFLASVDAPRIVLLLLILAVFILLGMFIDGLSILLIAVPLTYPAIIDLGYDGIWFGIVVVKCIEIGLITPPFGLNGFVVAGTTPGLSVSGAFKAVMWYLPLEGFVIILLILFPQIATWLPGIAGA